MHVSAENSTLYAYLTCWQYLAVTKITENKVQHDAKDPTHAVGSFSGNRAEEKILCQGRG